MIFRNWLMTQTKNPMTQLWVMTHRLGTTALELERNRAVVMHSMAGSVSRCVKRN